MSHRKIFAPFFFALFWCFLIAMPAVAADPVARASLQSKGTIYVGQQVLITVDILVPNYFLQPPQLPPLDLPGAIVTLQDGALNLNETIGGISYSGIQRTYIVVPQRAGEFTLPSAEITFDYAAVPGQTTQGKSSLPPLHFTVESAPGETAGSPGVVAAKITVTQDLSPDPKTLRAGDTLVRTITVRAEGLRAMMIPAVDFTAPEGVRIYGQDPVLSEETGPRGQPIAGVRKDVAQYLFAAAGQYELPAIDISWFDPATEKTESVSAAAIRVSVTDIPAVATGLAPPVQEPEEPAFNWFSAAMIAGAFLLAGLVIWLLAQALLILEQLLDQRRSGKRESERAYFRHVEQACGDGSPIAVEKALDNWSRKAGIVPLRPWIARFGNAETLKAFDVQREAIYGSEKKTFSSGEQLLSGLQAARAVWLAGTSSPSARWHGKSLPQLNPNWDGR